VICWSCEREAGAGPLCAACGAILPADEKQDGFAALGVPRKFSIDVGVAEANFKRLSRQVHPDRFATADPRARKAALSRTVQLNEAWRTLKDPMRRAEYLLELAGFGLKGDDRKRATPDAATREVTGRVKEIFSNRQAQDISASEESAVSRTESTEEDSYYEPTTTQQEGFTMNKLNIKGNWNILKGKLKQKYAQLSDDDLTYVEGKEDELIGKLQKKLGVSADEIRNMLSAGEL